jgi:hypothetical protein
MAAENLVNHWTAIGRILGPRMPASVALVGKVKIFPAAWVSPDTLNRLPKNFMPPRGSRSRRRTLRQSQTQCPSLLRTRRLPRAGSSRSSFRLKTWMKQRASQMTCFLRHYQFSILLLHSLMWQTCYGWKKRNLVMGCRFPWLATSRR